MFETFICQVVVLGYRDPGVLLQIEFYRNCRM